ncbi:MAG: DUF1592 domain-containing protein [Bryobacterales bacterium]|nr:DUF1592 domain-containing protein [Acidobacteriota bacterium]MCB9385483.1 DUF1592 domain-containing protein [Bryobacterales bacterium]
MKFVYRVMGFRLTRSILVPFLFAAALYGQSFQSDIRPVLEDSCIACHNGDSAAGGLNIEKYNSADDILASREQWEHIVQKIRTGEMPPRGIPRPSDEAVASFLGFVEQTFDKADANIKPDPGRVTARRLNRVEYSNTIHDLLGVTFRAQNDFPSDDSGHGFDNIADVLTISPVLMEKYMDAAERIASSAIGADPLPEKPIEAEYHLKHRTARRLDVSMIEAQHRVEWDGEYIIRIGLPGERPKDAAAVELALFMDGEKLHSQMAETKPSGLVYFDPYSVEEMRLFLPAGDHSFRIAFLNDDFPNGLEEKDLYDREKNKYIESITFEGPYPSDYEPERRKQILFCDPSSGDACVERILSKLARRAYRRPVTQEDVAPLVRFAKMSQQEGGTPEQGIQLALQAMLVSPHFLFRIEHDADPTDPGQVHRVSDVELASRLSYFLWGSMPDEELLALGEQGKLHEKDTLHAQVDRMLADERSATLGSTFAGQWLETRNLDHVNPDPKKFPSWGPELKEAMRTETEMFFESLLRENRPLSEFLTAKYTFLNGRLAKHYGVEGVTGPEFRRVEIDTPQRTGILGHASVLTVSSYPTRTSPVIRGKYVLENILGTPPPPPPANVPALDDGPQSTGSLRERLEQHRSNPVCASCHDRMDALGFGLENYDAIGRWRTEDGDYPIDSSGTLPSGETFEGPQGLTAVLETQMTDFARCLTEKMLTYSLGRGLERYDRRTIDQILKNVAADGNHFQTLVHEIVESLPFTMRRGEEVSEQTGPRGQEIARK